MSPKSLSQHELDLPVHIWHCERGELQHTSGSVRQLLLWLHRGLLWLPVTGI